MMKTIIQYLMDEGMETKWLEKLCQVDKEVIQATGKNNQLLSFNTEALMSSWMPLFKLVYNKLIPTMHTSHVPLD